MTMAKRRKRIPPSIFQNLEVNRTAHLVPLAKLPSWLVRAGVELAVPPVLVDLQQSPRLHRDRVIVVHQVVVIDLVNL